MKCILEVNVCCCRRMYYLSSQLQLVNIKQMGVSMATWQHKFCSKHKILYALKRIFCPLHVLRFWRDLLFIFVFPKLLAQEFVPVANVPPHIWRLCWQQPFWLWLMCQVAQEDRRVCPDGKWKSWKKASYPTAFYFICSYVSSDFLHKCLSIWNALTCPLLSPVVLLLE